MNQDHNPIIYHIPNIGESLIKKTMDPLISDKYDYPQFAFGFHHFVHTNKEKMELEEEFKGRKKVYLVLNPFEDHIDDYNGLENIVVDYLDLKDKPKIISNDFYKMWEMLVTFDLINDKKIVSAHLAEGPGSFVQATMLYREKFHKKDNKNDQYYAMTLHSEADNEHIMKMDEDFVKYYKKKGQFDLHRTYSRKESSKNDDKDNGDLTNPKSVLLFGGAFDINKKCDFITADAGVEWKNMATQEQESTRLVLGQILGALRLQAKDGTFICKFNETYTSVIIKVIALLTSLYKSVHIYKPLTSRHFESEKYLVCKNFNIDDKTREKLIKELEFILNKLYKNQNVSLTSIYPNWNLNKKDHAIITQCNNDISNRQLIAISKVVNFVEGGNFKGSVYEQAREEQIKATKLWVEHFFPDEKNLNNAQKKINEKNNKLIEINNKRYEKLNNHLVE